MQFTHSGSKQELLYLTMVKVEIRSPLQRLEKGEHSFKVDAAVIKGGVYFLRMQTGSSNSNKKLGNCNIS